MHKSKKDITQWPRGKMDKMIYNTLHRKLKIEQHEPQCKPGVNSGAPEELAVHAPLVTPVVLLVDDTNII